MNYKMKSCLAIHDLSGFGKCSLTTALPIISAAGVECSALPTAWLSNHTAFSDFSYLDLTEQMRPAAEVWKKLGISFDSLYTGFLGSAEQIDIVSGIIDDFRKEDTVVMVDPVMGDGGKLYRTISHEMAQGMSELCKKADIITPNMTEAHKLLGLEYCAGPYRKAYVERLLKELRELGPKYVVLTGVYFDNYQLGAACYDGENVSYSLYKKYEGMYHGTGDIFASSLLAAFLRTGDINFSLDTAAVFTEKTIERTFEAGENTLLGAKFEPFLGFLAKRIEDKAEEEQNSCNS